jgi:hypothetical protein
LGSGGGDMPCGALLADLIASRSALIFSALLRGLSARLSYVTLRRFEAGSCDDACASLDDVATFGALGAVVTGITGWL